MPLNTFVAAVHITPVFIKTFIKHLSKKAAKYSTDGAREEATDDVLYDEAFHIVKAFLELGTHETLESLQTFTNTHIVAPPWAAVSPVIVPLASCNGAADILINWFGPDELKKVVGGERWWQVRGLDGLEAEWVTERKFLKQDVDTVIVRQKEDELKCQLSEDEVDILKMEGLEPVMLYVHGGGYYFGSINTHRYQIQRYARKMRGRAFAVNYRKAPQYPWPCPLQDVLAAYMYLIRPPAAALHTAVNPDKVVLAGDSAGAALCLNVLTILRDMGLPQPAGAVLISPWVDLTHSFQSVMQNISTDIIPPHGFIHKPSTLWPVKALARSRARMTVTAPPPKPGHADALKPGSYREADDTSTEISENTANKSDGPSLPVKYKPSITQEHDPYGEPPPKPPKVLMDDPNATPLELRSQIQLYATNEQLTHPLVSPVIQGSLGNLCPLYIIAGDNEALRDEIIHTAHRAAHPNRYHPRADVLENAHRQKENIEKFTTPTKVHLQVFDGMCHVPTVFTFHRAVKYAYRSIAEFARHVTQESERLPAPVVFPELAKSKDSSPSSSSGSSSEILGPTQAAKNSTRSSRSSGFALNVSSSLFTGQKSTNGAALMKENSAQTMQDVRESVPKSQRQQAAAAIGDSNDEFADVVMIRQRVNIHGRVRQMEPEDDIGCLSTPASEICLMREAPVRRWLEGQERWDKVFKSKAKVVMKRRIKNEKKFEKILQRGLELGLLHSVDVSVDPECDGGSDGRDGGAVRHIQAERRWGLLDLEGDDPPPSAIAARRDTPDSIALLKSMMHHRAPRTIQRMPQRKTIDIVKAAFEPGNHPKLPPRQSVSEQQHVAETIPVHGLRLWATLMTYFGRKGRNKARKGGKRAASALSDAKRTGGESEKQADPAVTRIQA